MGGRLSFDQCRETESSFKFSEKMFERRNPNDELEIHWSRLHISILDHYFLYLSNICDIGKIRLPELLKDTIWTDSGSSAISATVRVSFAHKLRSVFMVPRVTEFHKSKKLIKKHQLVEAFISFLLQLMYHKADSIFDSCQDRLANVEKELRFLRIVLGDTSVIRFGEYHKGKFRKLISEFEAVANKAGSLVYYLLFSTDSTSATLDAGIFVVSSHVERLKYDIMEFIPLMRSSHTTLETSVMESFQVVDSLIYDLEYLMNREDKVIVDVDDPIKDLCEGLISLKSSIKEIGGPQSSEIEELRETLMRIADVANEAQYLVISFIVGDAPHWYLIERLTCVNHKVELCGTKLQQITMKHKLGGLHVAESYRSQLLSQREINTEVDDGTVGFEENESYVLDKLAGEVTHLQVIAIFGMPGLGKTTLVKKLYNHPLVSYWFDIRSWCVVSQIYQMRDLLTAILIHINSNFGVDRILNMERHSLMEHIFKTLKGRRYVIVLDDIWDPKVLDELLICLPDDGNGSRIVFTTRNKDVAPPSSIMYEMPRLTNDQCWELLQKKVFGNQHCPPELQGIGKQISANCGGLPLTVVVIAGILSRGDNEESTWKKVSGNIASYIFDDEVNAVLQIMKLSYSHLPQHLKPCFLYFGAFQKDREIPVGKLMRLWVAEGFVGMENKEIKAVDYLTELIDRSLVMVVKRRSDGGAKTCTIHDLLLDLCLKTCEEENFLKFVDSVHCSMYNEGHHLQTLQYSVTWSYCQHMHSLFGRDMILPLHIRDMRLLRVLQFDCRSTYLTGIEFMVSLRYLVVRDLPPSVGCLVNLEYLRVDTNETVCLSSSIMTMKKLRYICVGSEAIYDKDCNSSQTNNLEFLSRIVIEEPEDEEMLKCSPYLRKLKVSTYRHVDLSFIAQLESLNIRFYGLRVESIIFPTNIKKLTLFGRSLTSEEMSVIGRLKNLEVLKLRFISIEDERWDTRDDEFQKLKFFEMKVENLIEWNVDSSEHFPALERLVLSDCGNLQVIPSEIGEIATLQLIEVQGICKKSLLESAKEIQHEQVQMGNEELRIITNSARLSFEGSDVSIGFFEAETSNVLKDLEVEIPQRLTISIVGMPGLGKTTLAKKLYKDVHDNFPRRSWCVVSQTYTRRSLMMQILINLQSSSEYMNLFTEDQILEMDDQVLCLKVHQALSKNKYLIVLDDVWDSEAWHSLKICFPENENSSRILLTSRNKNAIPLDSRIHELPSLSNDQCWQLLTKLVFDDKPCPSELLCIGKEIAENCKGITHAVVVAAGILASTDKKQSTFEEVGRDLKSDIFYGGNNSVMESSFKHLPEYLRPCFLYFGVFHENENIHVRELLRCWVSEGFIGEKQGVSAEEEAEKYLLDLISRNLVKTGKTSLDGRVETCYVHGSLRPLCLQICEGENVLIFLKIWDKPRRAGGGNRFLEHIRSLLGRRWTSPSCVRDTRSLRILHCGYIDTRYTGIEFLVSLKYLVIKEVPPSIGSFVNLEYLRVETDDEQVYLSSAIMKMMKLRCIHVGSISMAAYDEDCDTSQTNNLEYLSRIWVRELHDEEMLKCSPYLRKLKLSTTRRLDLSFRTLLESLSITFYKLKVEGISFPSNIKNLSLCGSESKFDQDDMSMIGRMVNLEVLKLKWFSYVGNIWVTKEGEFQKLRFLKLDGITDLTLWEVGSSSNFCYLRRMILRNPYHLEGIPLEIGELDNLEMIEVQGQCLESLVESAKYIRQQCEDFGNTSLRVIISTDSYRLNLRSSMIARMEALNATNAMSNPF